MTSIDKYLKEFEAFFHGHPSERERVAFDEKLAADPNMRDAWNEYQSIMKALSDKESVSLRIMLNRISYRYTQSAKVQKLNHSLWFRLSAAAVFIVIIGCLLYFFCTSRGEEFASDSGIMDTLMVVTDDSTLLVSEDIKPIMENENEDFRSTKIASLYDDEKYQIAPAFAELLHNVYRNYWFNLSSPSDSVLFQSADSITFSWESNIYEAIYFDVLSRDGKVVYRHKYPIESPWTFKPDLDPAIYMFRFSTKDQPIWMGVMVGV